MTSGAHHPRAEPPHNPPIRRAPIATTTHLTAPLLACALLACVLPASCSTPLKATSDVLAQHDAHQMKLPGAALQQHEPAEGVAGLSVAAKAHAVHAKTLAMQRLGVKAGGAAPANTQTDFQIQGDAEEDKSNKQTASILPFLLPPIGLLILTTIGCAVVGIRRWQKIPSMPTQGRMDIADVKASAARAGGIRTPPATASTEMRPQWG